MAITEFGYTEQEADLTQNFHRTALQINDLNGRVIKALLEKTVPAIEGKPTLHPDMGKIAVAASQLATQYFKMAADIEAQRQKLDLKREALQGPKLNADEMGPRELEAFLKALILKVGADKVRALLP